MRAQRLASRKDLAVHVSLSSDLIVKQHACDAFRSETSSPQFFNWVALGPRNSRETLRNAASRRRRQRGRYMSSSIELSTTIQKNFAFLARCRETPADRTAKCLTPRAFAIWWEVRGLQDRPVNFGENSPARAPPVPRLSCRPLRPASAETASPNPHAALRTRSLRATAADQNRHLCALATRKSRNT